MEIRVQSVYSDTLEPDEMGRWARQVHVANFTKKGVKFNKKYLRWESLRIAWISRVEIKERDGTVKIIYPINYEFPNQGKLSFGDPEQAIEEVKKEFAIFKELINK